MTTNSPMNHTQMTQHTKMSHPFVDPDQSEMDFFRNWATYTKNIKTLSQKKTAGKIGGIKCIDDVIAL